MTDWSNEKVLVLGLGRSGISAAEYLARRKAKVMLSENAEVNDAKAEQASKLRNLGIEVEFGGHSDRAKDFAKLVIVSPGIAPGSEIIRQLEEKGKDIICDVELAARESTIPLVGITGTNGKSTTTALVSHILARPVRGFRTAKRVFRCGARRFVRPPPSLSRWRHDSALTPHVPIRLAPTEPGTAR